jgi:hypothetical protein
VQSLPGDLVRVLRRAVVHKTLFYTPAIILPSNNRIRSGRWNSKTRLYNNDSYPLAIVVGVFEEPPRGLEKPQVHRWNFVVTPEVIGWVMDIKKNTINPMYIELVERPNGT